MTIVRSTALQSFDDFCGNLKDLISLLVSGDDPENHILPGRESIPGCDAKRNIIIFGRNVSEESKKSYLNQYSEDDLYRKDNDGKFLLDDSGGRVSKLVTYNGLKHGLYGLYEIAKSTSIYLIANGIDCGSKAAHGAKTIRMIAVEGDYFDSLDEQIPFILQICKKYNIPEPTYYYISGGKSVHFAWIFSEPVPAEVGWFIWMQLLRKLGFDGCEGNESSLAGMLTRSFRIGGKKEKPAKDGNFYYGSFKCFSLDNIYSPDDFNSLFEKPLGRWNDKFSKDALDVDGFPILNGSTPIKLRPEESYSPEERLLDDWRDKFHPYDQNEIAEAKKLLDSFSAERVVHVKASGNSVGSIGTRKEIEELKNSATVTSWGLLDFISLSARGLIESGSIPTQRRQAYKQLCYILPKTYNYLLGLGLVTPNTPEDCLMLWADNSKMENNHESRKSAFAFLKKTQLICFDLDSKKEKEVRAIQELNNKIARYCRRAKIANPLDSKPDVKPESKPESDVDNNSVVTTNLLAKATTDYSTFSYVDGGWKRVAEFGDYDLHIVFDKDLLKEAMEATIALPDKKQKEADWLDAENQKILEPYVGEKRKVVIKGATSKNWSRANLKALGGFCYAKGAGRVFVDDQPFEYFQVSDELSLSGDDVKEIHEPFLKAQPLIDLIDREKARLIFLESQQGTGKTQTGYAIALYLSILMNLPIVGIYPTRSLRDNAALQLKKILGYSLPIVDKDWFTNKPSKENFKGFLLCSDSVGTKGVTYLEENGIDRVILLCDESSQTVKHIHFADTAISAKRAKDLYSHSKIFSKAAITLAMDADQVNPAVKFLESKVRGNVLKVKNTFKTHRKFITWNQNSPHTMLNAAVEIKRKLPDSTVLIISQAKKLTSSLSPVNLKKHLVDLGFCADDVILLDSDSISNPDHPAHKIKYDKDEFDKFFSEYIKGKIVIGNPFMFKTGTNINRHCIDFTFDICQGKGDPTGVLQQCMRVRDREGLERHIFINNCGLDHPRYKGYSPEKVRQSIEDIKDRSDKEYEKLGGKVDFSLLRSDLDSAEFANHSMFLQTLFVRSYGKIAYGLMKFKQGWELVDSDEWLKQHTFSFSDAFDTSQDLILMKEDYEAIANDSVTKEAIREIRLEGEVEVLNAIATSELVSSDEAKALRRSQTDLSFEEQIKLDRYDFHKATLGLVDCDVKNISRWQDGYYRQLRYQFYFLKDTQQYLRLRESKNIEINNHDGHTFDFDRLSKSHLAGYGFLRELNVDKLINEIRRIAKGGSTEDHIYLKSAPVKVDLPYQKCEKYQLDPDADHYGIPLNFDKGSPFELIYHRLISNKMKCYNLLGFSPVNNVSLTIERVIEKFGYARVSNGKKGKALKHYLILFDDNREEFFSHLLHHHQSSIYSEHNPDRDFIWDLASVGSSVDPITQDYKLVQNGVRNLKDGSGSPNILDLLDIGAAEPLEDVLPLWFNIPARQLRLV